MTQNDKDSHHNHDGHHKHPETTSDPVCGMVVDAQSTEFKCVHDSKEYFFCSKNCQEKFQADPEKYAAKKTDVRSPAPPEHTDDTEKPAGDALYTCPMHPEVKQKGPGPCPKCGMALEPMEVSISIERVEYT